MMLSSYRRLFVLFAILTSLAAKAAAVDPLALPPENVASTLLGRLAMQSEIVFHEMPLQDALALVSKQSQVNIVIDNLALERAGVDKLTPVTVQIQGTTLRSALKILLEPLGLTAVPQNEVLKITAAAQPKAQPPAASLPPVYFPAPNANEVRIAAALDQPTDIAFAETPLSDAIEFLRDYHQIPIWIDVAALQDEGVDPAMPYHLEMKGITLRSALRLMLEPLGLTSMIESEVLKITTRTVADSKIIARVYPVGDLTQSPDDLKALEEAIRVGTNGSWNTEEPAGPGAMAVVPRSASLVVKQTYLVHEEIVELLTNLRRAQELPKPTADLNLLPTY